MNDLSNFDRGFPAVLEYLMLKFFPGMIDIPCLGNQQRTAVNIIMVTMLPASHMFLLNTVYSLLKRLASYSQHYRILCTEKIKERDDFWNSSYGLHLSLLIILQSLCKLMEKILSTHLHYAKDKICSEPEHEHRASVVWIFSQSDYILRFNCYCKTGRGGVLKS